MHACPEHTSCEASHTASPRRLCAPIAAATERRLLQLHSGLQDGKLRMRPCTHVRCAVGYPRQLLVAVACCCTPGRCDHFTCKHACRCVRGECTAPSVRALSCGLAAAAPRRYSQLKRTVCLSPTECPSEFCDLHEARSRSRCFARCVRAGRRASAACSMEQGGVICGLRSAFEGAILAVQSRGAMIGPMCGTGTGASIHGMGAIGAADPSRPNARRAEGKRAFRAPCCLRLPSQAWFTRSGEWDICSSRLRTNTNRASDQAMTTHVRPVPAAHALALGRRTALLSVGVSGLRRHVLSVPASPASIQ